MRGLSYKDKVKVYKARKNGMSYSTIKAKYNINTSNARYIINMIDKHGFDVLKRNGNAKYSNEFMQKAKKVEFIINLIFFFLLTRSNKRTTILLY